MGVIPTTFDSSHHSAHQVCIRKDGALYKGLEMTSEGTETKLDPQTIWKDMTGSSEPFD